MDDLQTFLKEDDVLSTPASALMYQCTFKVSEFLIIMQSKLEEKLFTDGMDCELLSSGKPWTKGKLRMRLEFCPNEPEIQEQKALPAASDELDTTPNNPEDSLDKTNTDPELDVKESTTISDNSPISPISRYPDNDPDSVGMWS
jgi:KGK domain